MTSHGAELAAFVAGLRWADVSPGGRSLVGDRVLDTLGCMLAAVGGPSWAVVFEDNAGAASAQRTWRRFGT
ncbi:hypothetical protein [Microlunatus ginsengisoli]|uniref:Uncharacterized protein n=1 Tax=Microlunatus ginsengisoli TaxID=363863 RepID=A0ABP7A7G7_9ACTN